MTECILPKIEEKARKAEMPCLSTVTQPHTGNPNQHSKGNNKK